MMKWHFVLVVFIALVVFLIWGVKKTMKVLKEDQDDYHNAKGIYGEFDTEEDNEQQSKDA